MTERTGLERTVTEIAMRATATVCEGIHPSRLEAVAYPLAEALMDVLIDRDSGETNEKMYRVEVPDYTVFELWNRILDEVEKEMIAANKIEVIVNRCTRTERRGLFSEAWKKTISTPHPNLKKI